jgi:predicted  nucleic acid-binding Zn-ribbon protein
MKRRIFTGLAGLTMLIVTQITVHAAGPELSPQRLDMLDRRGYFTPTFKQAVHDLVNAKQAVVDAKNEQKKLEDELPDLEKQAAEAAAKVAGLQKQLADLNHLDESDFSDLQTKMGAPDQSGDLEKQLAASSQISASDFEELKKMIDQANALLKEQLTLAQAYVWAYPTSPHQADARHDLQDVQKKMTDLAQALTDAEAARVAAHQKLVQRAQARDLSIVEWRDFLLNMSKEDLLKLLGRPQSSSEDNWTYTGGWTEDAVTHQKVGLNITFNAERVMNVSEVTQPTISAPPGP